MSNSRRGLELGAYIPNLVGERERGEKTAVGRTNRFH